jgi:hypothetical protein
VSICLLYTADKALDGLHMVSLELAGARPCRSERGRWANGSCLGREWEGSGDQCYWLFPCGSPKRNWDPHPSRVYCPSQAIVPDPKLRLLDTTPISTASRVKGLSLGGKTWGMHEAAYYSVCRNRPRNQLHHPGVFLYHPILLRNAVRKSDPTVRVYRPTSA